MKKIIYAISFKIILLVVPAGLFFLSTGRVTALDMEYSNKLMYPEDDSSKKNQFSLSYNFDHTLTPSVTSGSESLIAEEAFLGGSKLKSVGFITEKATVAWHGELDRGNNHVYDNAFVRLNIYPKKGYKLNVTSIQVRQKGMEDENNYFRVGCTISGNSPDMEQQAQSSEIIQFRDIFTNHSFSPGSKFSTAKGADYLSVWIGARGNGPERFQWMMDEITINGTYEKEEATHHIKISDKVKQTIKLGVDVERLWDWNMDMKEELAHVGVGEMRSEYIRVAIDARYGREEGIKNESAYADELEMMEAMKSVNPQIKFFASPRPLFEVYTKEEREEIWGHKDNTPWSPYPRWILEWDQNGTKTMSDGSIVPRWEEKPLRLKELVQYFADYLNLMHRHGFKITYMDVTNEKETISASANKYIHDNLPKLLEPGVYMPGLVVPSSWAVSGATNWLEKVDTSKNEQASIAVAATHNTGPGGVYEEFVKKANKLDIKEVWNTEMHGWTGVDLHEEIMTSEVFWKHLRAGFTGIDTWLFFGPAKGRGHTMIWVDHKNKTFTKSGKYEIFKQVVNNANGGNFVEITMPYEATPTAAFIKDNVLSVWILNKSKLPMKDTRFDVGNKKISNNKCEVYRWHKDLPRSGEKKNLSISQHSFNYNIEGESLYFFKIQLD